MTGSVDTALTAFAGALGRVRRWASRGSPPEEVATRSYASLGELEADVRRLGAEGWTLQSIAGVPEDVDLGAAILAGTLDDVLRASFGGSAQEPVTVVYRRGGAWGEETEAVATGVSSGFGRLEDPRLSLVEIAADLAEAPEGAVPRLLGRVNRVIRFGLEPVDEALAYAMLVKLNARKGDLAAADRAGGRCRERLARIMGLEPDQRHDFVHRNVVSWPDALLESHHLFLDELFVERPWLAFVFRDPSLYVSYRAWVTSRARRRAAIDAYRAPLPAAQVRFLVAARLFELERTAEALSHLERLELDAAADPELFVCAATVRGIARHDAGDIAGARRDWEEVAQFDLGQRRDDVRAGPLLSYWTILAQALLEEPDLDEHVDGGGATPFRRSPADGRSGPSEPPSAA